MSMRFVIVKPHLGGYVLADGRQGRWTWATREEADGVLAERLANTSDSTLRQVYGNFSKLAVGEVECYEGHHDPKKWYLDAL